MQKLGVVREDITPGEEKDSGEFEFQHDKTGEGKMIKKAEEILEGSEQSCDGNCRCKKSE